MTANPSRLRRWNSRCFRNSRRKTYPRGQTPNPYARKAGTSANTTATDRGRRVDTPEYRQRTAATVRRQCTEVTVRVSPRFRNSGARCPPAPPRARYRTRRVAPGELLSSYALASRWRLRQLEAPKTQRNTRRRAYPPFRHKYSTRTRVTSRLWNHRPRFEIERFP